MPLQLGNVSSYGNNAQTRQTAGSADASSVSNAQTSARVSSQIALTQGQTIQGQVKSLNGNQIVLNLGNNVEINARLSQQANLSVGQNILFEVTSAANQRISLLPLYTNTATNSTVLSALKAAELPVTAENMQMVSTMIKEGMSIDKSSVLEMSRLAAEYTDYAPSSVVELTGMGVEITPTNLTQLEAYHNMNYQLLDAATELTSDFGSLVNEFALNGQVQESLQLMSQVLTNLTPDTAAQNAIPAEAILTAAEAVNVATEVVVPAEGEAPAEEAQTLPQVATENMAESTAAMVENNAAKSGFLNGLRGMVNGAADFVLENLNGQDSGVMLSLSSEISESGMHAIQTALQSRDPAQLVHALQQSNAATIVAVMEQGELLPEFTQMLQTLEQTLADGEAFPVMFQDLKDAFTNVFGAQISKEWMISPQEFADKEQVKAMYERIARETNSLNQTLASFGKENSAAGQHLGQMNQNLDFMNALNQMFPYVQIPLRASMENAHGDLYVYSNRKGKVSEDGSVSALLHLEMQHLGDMDVYVKLKDSNVTTHFYLQDESMIDFLEGNMPLLTKRLEEGGYHVNSEVSGRGEMNRSGEDLPKSNDVVSRIRGLEGDQRLINYRSFDVRA